MGDLSNMLAKDCTLTFIVSAKVNVGPEKIQEIYDMKGSGENWQQTFNFFNKTRYDDTMTP